MAAINRWFLAILIYSALLTTHADPIATAKQALDALRPRSLQSRNGSAFFQAGLNCYAERLLRVTYLVEADAVLFFFNDQKGACYIAAIYTDKVASAPTGQYCLIDAAEYALLFKPEFRQAAREKTQANNAAFAQFVAALDACFKPNTVLAMTIIESIRESRQMRSAWN